MAKVTDAQILKRLRDLGDPAKSSDNALLLKALAKALDKAAKSAKPMVGVHLEAAADEIERALLQSSSGLL